jgi:cystathionine beta-lyase/cystathionine gamma-synthase
MTIAIDPRHVAPAECARRGAAPGLDTVAVRGGEPTRHGYAAVATPIVCTATYSFADSAEIADHFEGRVEREEYGRYGNPTVRAAEQKISALEGSEDTVLFPSGMSAITSLLLALLKPGDHVVMTSDCYRRTRQFLRTSLASSTASWRRMTTRPSSRRFRGRARACC